MSRRIPLLDLSHYTRGTAQERDTCIKAWGDGLKEFGFVSIVNHGVDPELIARTYAARLFSTPISGISIRAKTEVSTRYRGSLT